mmetsp:Transcript_24053/g.51136  ORF Transcript_24053/g.51136 Transcript_24053/m.51136 type:complete len:170 (+) Transcript_24053:266-775(+)
MGGVVGAAVDAVVAATSREHQQVSPRTPIEVGVVVGLFLLAIGCLARTLDRRAGGSCCEELLRRDDDDDGSSYIEDHDERRGSFSRAVPPPHVFESLLHEFVFFEAPGGETEPVESGAAGVPERPGIDRRKATAMEGLFPDLLGGSGNREGNDNGNNGAGGAEPREPPV